MVTPAPTTTATRTRKHLADNGTARCSTDGATLPVTDSEAARRTLALAAGLGDTEVTGDELAMRPLDGSCTRFTLAV